MDIKKGFVFRPLPAISAPKVEPTLRLFRTTDAKRAKGVTNFDKAIFKKSPLGPLHDLLGEWHGKGFNMIWRPLQPAKGADHFLELNLTNETLQFEAIPGDIPNRGLLQDDIVMHGLTYLQQISDANIGAGLHVEPGIWAIVPPTTNPLEAATVVRMASIPHGTTILAQGLVTQLNGSPTIPGVDITPFFIGNPHNPVPFPSESVLTNASAFRSPPNQLAGVTQPMVDNPNSVLMAALAGKTVVSTVVLQVSTSLSLVNAGGGTSNTAFLAAAPPNANAVQVDATFWLETIKNPKGKGTFLQLQYSQTVMLNFAPLTWPHITVGTLVKKKRKPMV